MLKLKQIPNIPIVYAAGSDGKIYSYSNARTNAKKKKPFPLAQVKNGNQYYLVTICLGMKKRSYCAHTLICSAFHGAKPFKAACVRHLDGNRLNNKPENLQWGTYAQNEADKRRHGRTACGEKQGCAKLTEEAVRMLRIAIPRGLWNYVDAAKVFGVEPSTIRQAVIRKTWLHIE